MSFWAQFMPAACVHSDGKPAALGLVDGRETVYYSRGAYLGMASRCGRTVVERWRDERRYIEGVCALGRVPGLLGHLGICPAAARAYAVPEWLGPEPAPIHVCVAHVIQHP